MKLLSSLKQWAYHLKTETYALYLAARDPATPWYAKFLAAVVAAYAFSPIDLIPDFIPVLGYLDDLILLPLGIMLAIRLVPSPVMTKCRERAACELRNRPVSRRAGVVIVAIWGVLTATGIVWVYRACR